MRRTLDPNRPGRAIPSLGSQFRGFDDLPNELLHHIADSVTDDRDFLALALVEKRLLLPARERTDWKLNSLKGTLDFLERLIESPNFCRSVYDISAAGTAGLDAQESPTAYRLRIRASILVIEQIAYTMRNIKFGALPNNHDAQVRILNTLTSTNASTAPMLRTVALGGFSGSPNEWNNGLHVILPNLLPKFLKACEKIERADLAINLTSTSRFEPCNLADECRLVITGYTDENLINFAKAVFPRAGKFIKAIMCGAAGEVTMRGFHQVCQQINQTSNAQISLTITTPHVFSEWQSPQTLPLSQEVEAESQLSFQERGGWVASRQMTVLRKRGSWAHVLAEIRATAREIARNPLPPLAINLRIKKTPDFTANDKRNLQLCVKDIGIGEIQYE